MSRQREKTLCIQIAANNLGQGEYGQYWTKFNQGKRQNELWKAELTPLEGGACRAIMAGVEILVCIQV